MGEGEGGFRFGLEAEFVLVDAATFRPLWYQDLRFEALHDLLTSIPLADLGPMEGLRLEVPHRVRMPYVVEGYHLPDPDLNPVDLLPKGIEIRTPIRSSIEDCLSTLRTLYLRLQTALATKGYQAVALSHHPIEHTFSGPQNKRRHDFWQWAMKAMLTYGPDINVGLPQGMFERLDSDDLHAKVNYYAPALTALTLASPFYRGGLWQTRGRIGKAVRTYNRSVVAPALEIHPDQAGRLEFKSFEMSPRVADYHGFFLMWLALLLDDGLAGRASEQSRVYDLGAAARDGIAAESLAPRAHEVLSRAPSVLKPWGFDVRPLETFSQRLQSEHVPADDMIELYQRHQSIEAVLRHLVLD